MVSIATVFTPHSRIEVLRQTESLSEVVIVLKDDNIGTYAAIVPNSKQSVNKLFSVARYCKRDP